MKQNYTIRHSLPGRVRFHVRDLRRNEPLADRLTMGLESLSGVEDIRINLKGGLCVVRYSAAALMQGDVERRLTESLSGGADHVLPTACPANPPSCVSPLCECTACASTEAGCDPVKPALRRFVAISAVMGTVFVRTTVLGLTVAETALSPLGLIAMGLSWPLIKKAVKKTRERKFSLESLLGASCVAAVAAGEALTAFEVLWINSGAELLKAWITERSRKSISEILQVTSHHTFILVNGVEMEAEVASLKPGDVVVLHTGEKVCVDGEIVDGACLMDESPITGRPDFVHRKAGEQVLAGTFVREGVIYVRADEVGDRTYLSRVLRLVEDSLENRAPIEGVADRLAANLVKIGFLVTGGTLLLTGSLWRAFTVMLVMACPCATVLAASTAVSAAMSAAAKRGILIKGGRYLEEVGKTDTVCFDKTGTLTTAEPVLAGIVPVVDTDRDMLLELAYSVETHNHHPLAQAVKAEARARGIEALPHTVCEYTLGKGMRAVVDGDELLVGNAKLMMAHGVDVTPSVPKSSPLKQRGLTVLYLARNKEVIGLLAFDNLVRPESETVVERLRQNGVKRVVLITGDEENTTRELAERLGVDGHHASILPEEKSTIVRETMDSGHRVLMVGDGINDALALTEADVGVAMGAGGSEVAVEAADIALIDDDLEGLVYVHSLSGATMKVVQQNFWIATGSNVFGVVLGATGLLSPVMAGMLHIVHSLGVLANSSRLLKYQPPALEAGTSEKG